MKTRKYALVVDDEESIRYVLTRFLGLLGYECITASSGAEALEKYAGKRFNLVMLDVKMPGMSGLEVLAKIRGQDPGTRVVMLSAIVDPTVAMEALRLGADDYITKPFSFETLSTRLRSEGASNHADNSVAQITNDLIMQALAQL